MLLFCAVPKRDPNVLHPYVRGWRFMLSSCISVIFTANISDVYTSMSPNMVSLLRRIDVPSQR